MTAEPAALETNMFEIKRASISAVSLIPRWWVSLLISAAACVTWRILVPILKFAHPDFAHLAAGLVRVAPSLTIMFAAVTAVTLLSAVEQRRSIKRGR